MISLVEVAITLSYKFLFELGLEEYFVIFRIANVTQGHCRRHELVLRVKAMLELELGM